VARPFLTEAAKTALVAAVRAVEASSRAEVVVVVRPRSAPYRDASLLGALAAVFGALAFLLFSPWEFGLLWFLVDPALAGLLVGLAVHRSHLLIRLLTSTAARQTAVRDAARVTFLDRDVTATRERTGLLLYISLLERGAELVADRGVLDAVGAADWRRAAAALVAAVDSGADGEGVAEQLRGLGDLLAEALPARADDVNELPDEVVTT